MSDPGAPSGAVAEITTTAGTGPYQLNPNSPNALSAYFRFVDVFADGAIIPIEVDDTAKKEIIVSTFDAVANTLSRDPTAVLFSSNGNALVDWPATGQRTVRPLSLFPLCDTPPTDGQALVWDAAIMKYCPGDVSGVDDDTWDMQDVTSGTSV
jgi:hypothetical protein